MSEWEGELKNTISRIFFGLVLVAAIFQLSTCKLQQLAQTSDGFKEDDYLYYYLFIDDEIKNIPRINNDYYFEFSAMDGPKPEVSRIVFSGGGRINAVEAYLLSVGYHLGDADPGKGQRIYQSWHKRSPSTDEIRLFVAEDSVTIEKYKY